MPKPLFLPLAIRKLADKTACVREARYHPETGERYLYDPSTPGFDPEPWPLAGVQIEGDTPKLLRIPMKTVAQWRREGFLTLDGARSVIRSGGPPEEPERELHHFLQGDAIVLHTVDGDVRWKVLESPDKWPDSKTDAPAGFPADDCGFGGEVRWYFDAELEA